MGHLYITGDKHGNKDSLYHVIQETKLANGDWLIILGDFGFIWNGEWKKNLYKISKMTEGNLLVVLGNHENYDIIEKQMASAWYEEVGNYAYHPSENVYIVFDGGYYELCGKKIFCVNGANSTDRYNRIEGRDWWPQEELTYEQMDSIACEMDKHPEVDIVCSHCTSAEIKSIMWPQYSYMPYPMERFMDFVYKGLKFENAYFGHYHDDVNLGKYHCLYDSWVQIC